MPPRPTPPLRYAISIDGQAVRVQNPTGGYVKAEVLTGDGGQTPSRHITSIGYTNLRVQLELELGNQILNWVNATLKGAPTKKNGSLIELDDQNRARSYLDFTEAAIVDFVVPGFDGASNAANTFILEASIKKSVLRRGDNSPIQLPSRSKPFLASNFRLTVGDLPTTRVRTVAPVSFHRKGDDQSLHRGLTIPSDLIVTLSDRDIDPWQAWADDFIVKGNNGQDKEKQGKLEVLAPNITDVLATVDLKQIGIFELVPTDDAAIRSHRAGLYFEAGQLSLSGTP